MQQARSNNNAVSNMLPGGGDGIFRQSSTVSDTAGDLASINRAESTRAHYRQGTPPARPARPMSQLALPQLPSQVLDELPGDAARTAAARYRPLHRLRAQCVGADGKLHGRGVALDHREERVLIAIMEPEPQAKAIRERDFFLGRLGRVD